MPDSRTTRSYTMALCGDCPSGPPCRCSSDPSVVGRVWSSGAWRWVATCKPEVQHHEPGQNDDFKIVMTLTAVPTCLRALSNETLAKAFSMVAKAVEEYPTGEIVVEFSGDRRMRCVNLQSSVDRVVCR